MNDFFIGRKNRSLATLCMGVTIAAMTAPAQAQNTSEWRIELTRFGGTAKICADRRRRNVCAVVYCGRGTDGLEVGLTGWEPRGRGDRRRGEIQIDNRARRIVFDKERTRLLGDVWRMRLENRRARLIDRMQQGRDMTIDIGRRGRPFEFALDGSFRTISRLENRCDGADTRQATLNDRGARNTDNDANTIRLGNDNFGIRLSFGGNRADGETRERDMFRGRRWNKLADETVNRRRDRDVVNLSRRDGRFDAIGLRAVRNDVRLRRVRVTYGNGVEQQLDVDRRLNAGTSNVLELRGRRGRFLEKVELVYATAGAGRRAQLEVWGRSTRTN